VNRLAFAITAYLFLALHNGLAPLWTVRDTTPNLLLILAVFVGVSAPRAATLGSALILGVLLDLQPGPLRGSGVILGPHALGYLVGGYAVLQLRHLLFRESIITIVLMVLAMGGFAALVESVLYAFRGLPWLANDPLNGSATQQLGRRLLEVLYTAVAAIPVGLLLQSTRKWWGFQGRAKGEKVF
jgi:rod shape-determining protein MreD